MKKIHNNYTNSAAMLICCSLALSTSTPPFYLDIVLAFIAVIYGIVGYEKGES